MSDLRIQCTTNFEKEQKCNNNDIIVTSLPFFFFQYLAYTPTSLLTSEVSAGYYIISNDSRPPINNETDRVARFGEANARLLPVGPIAFFSDDDNDDNDDGDDDNDNYDVVESMSHRVYRPYGMFTLAKRTNSHMSKSRLHNVSPAPPPPPSPLSLSLFRIFRRESGGWITRFSY